MRPLPYLLGAALLAAALVPVTAPAGSAADVSETSGRLVLLLDSSGSMKDATPGGGTKIEAAKAALSDVADELPDGVEVGVRVFGATVENRSQPGACADTQNVVPVGPVDRTAIKSAVAKYQPYGETPIGNALKGAAKDLGAAKDGDRRTIVLLSDGEPTCAPDPCKVAQQLRSQGIDLRINVVGLDVAGKARSALQCIARAGGGRYFDADSAEELADSMVQVSVRGLREFSLSGEPVVGGTTTAAPTEVEPGDYVDTTLADGAPKYYLVDVPENGAVSASMVARPENGSTVDSGTVTLMTPDGTRCTYGMGQKANVLGLRSIVGISAYYGVATDRSTSKPCAETEQMLVSVSYKGPASPFSLRVRAYPEIENFDELPGPVASSDKNTWQRPVALTGTGTPVIGGASFEEAPTLEPGTTYSDTLRPREQLIYKVPVGWGQSPRFTARLETDPTADKLQGVVGIQVISAAFNPLGHALQRAFNSDTGVNPAGRYNGSQQVTVTSAYPPVRLRNLEPFEYELNQNSQAGDYYFTLEMGGDPNRADEQFAAPVRLAVALDGEVSGEPQYAGEVEGGTAGSETSDDSETSEEADTAGAEEAKAEDSSAGFVVAPWMLVVGGVVVLVLVAAAVLAGLRAGRRQAG